MTSPIPAAVTPMAVAPGPGWRLHARHWTTDGPSVLLIHGMVVAGRSMTPLAVELARRGLAVWVPDLPGFGASERPPRALSVDGLANALGQWANRVGFPAGAVVGNSFGTQVAAALAERHSELVTRLVLVAPTIDPRWQRARLARLLPRSERSTGCAQGAPGGWWRRSLRRLVVPAEPFDGPEPPSMRKPILSEYAGAGPGRVLSTYRWAVVDDLQARMASMRPPVLVIRGQADGLVTPEWAEHLARRAPEGTYRELANADHDAEYHAPARLADTMAPFLLTDGR